MSIEQGIEFRPVRRDPYGNLLPDSVDEVLRPTFSSPNQSAEQQAISELHNKIDAETQRAIREYENPKLAFSNADPTPESPEWLRRKIANEEITLKSELARLQSKREGL